MRGSRSSLRRIGVPYVGRKRRYWLRALCLALIITAFCAFLWSVQTQYFSKDGVGAAIYAFHDNVYLWAKGQAWVMLFPYALIWMIPVGTAVALTALAYVTPLDPIRSLHQRLILMVVKYRWANVFLARPLGKRQIKPAIWVASLTPMAVMPPRLFGFARRVVRRAQEELWRRIAVGLADGTPISPRPAKRLALLSGMRLRFDPSDGVGHMRALEVIAATLSAPATQKLAQRMADFYSAQKSTAASAPLAAALKTLRNLDVQDSVSATRELVKITTALQSVTTKDVAPDAALELGCHALVANFIGWHYRLPEITQFQRLWVKSRLTHTPPEIGEAIETAEGLIFFELWSKLAEVTPTAPQDRSLLALALGSKERDVTGLMGAAEHFAWTGATR